MSETNEPVTLWRTVGGEWRKTGNGAFTCHEYRALPVAEWDAALAAAYARGREEAAKVCEGLAEGRWREPDVFDDERYAARECAAAIRAGGA